MTHFHAFLADFLPNYAVLMYSPSVEMLSKVFDCRLSTHEWIFHNSLDDICFVGPHWTMSVLSLVLVCLFTNSVVRYSKILKLLRKHFDFKDKEWCIYLDSVSKTFILILYFNIGNKEFLQTTTALLAILALCSLIGKPNDIFWYNYFRGGMYAYSAVICAVILAIELKTSISDYPGRESIGATIGFAVLLGTSLLSVVTYLFIASQYKLGMSRKELKRKEEELKKFFAAFGDEESQEAESAMVSEQQQHQQLELGGGSVLSSRMNSSHMNSQSLATFEPGQFSSTQWRQFDSMIQAAKKIDLLKKEEYKFIKLAIKYEDPIIPLIFSRSGRNLNRFVDHLKLKVYQVLAKDNTIQSTWSKPAHPLVGRQIINNPTERGPSHLTPLVNHTITHSSLHSSTPSSRPSQHRTSHSQSQHVISHLHSIKRLSMEPVESRISQGLHQVDPLQDGSNNPGLGPQNQRLRPDHGPSLSTRHSRRVSENLGAIGETDSKLGEDS
ncbi:hypothetical protein BDR26DRAFT_860189 [Obelidium mucronatum]|nr:hypothetical protein BDR26DRAFT_860189 [Obelidium mucronatum]